MTPMWISVIVLGVITVGISMLYLLTGSPQASELDLGEVSESWLNQKLADKSEP